MQRFKALVVLFFFAAVYISFTEAFHIGQTGAGSPQRKGKRPQFAQFIDLPFLERALEIYDVYTYIHSIP